MVTTEEQHVRDGAPSGPPRKARRRAVLAGALGALALGGVLAVEALRGEDGDPAGAPGAAAPEWTPRAHRDPATLDRKLTCAYTDHSISTAEAFGEYLGRPLDCVVVFVDEKDWTSLVEPWWAFHQPSDDKDWRAWKAEAPEERRLIVSQSLVPDGAPDDWRERGARGEYDERWRTFGRNMVEAGLGDSVIRLAWEMNGTWYPHHYVGESAEERELWKTYWRRAVEAMEVPGSSFEIDFNIAEGPQNSVELSEFYPGDDWVDIIGIDLYDSWLNPIDPTQRWEAKAAKINSVEDVVAFAAERGKPISIPEWAMVAPGDTKGGGDNAHFVSQVADVVANTPTYYQGYFNTTGGGVGMTLSDAPEGSAEYLRRFGPSGDAVPTGL